MAVEDAPPASGPRLTEEAGYGVQLDPDELARIDALAQRCSTASHTVSR